MTLRPMDVTPEVIDALAALRRFAADESRNSLNTVSREAAEAINVLDNVQVFAVIDEATGYDVDPERVAETPQGPGGYVGGYWIPDN